MIWGDTLKKKPWILKWIKVYFSAMQSMNVGKSASHFLEKAEELDNCVLTNKTLQTTRFVRALLRGITAALRNLPTLIAVISKEYNEATTNHEATKSNELGKLLNSLRNAELLFFTIGLAQILEIYSGVSLEVQHASHFPIQLWTRIDDAKAELRSLSDHWVWKDGNLKMAGIGNPDYLTKDILSDGVFRPYVPSGCIRSKITKVKDSNNLETAGENINDDDDNIDLFDEENEPCFDPAGSQPMIDANQATLERVEKKLKEVTKELIANWDRRQIKTELQKATLEAFGQIQNIESPASIELIIELMQTVITSLPSNQSESIIAQECFAGFSDWNRFWSESFNDAKIKRPDLNALQDVHIYYENWVKTSKKSDSNKKFQQLWELVMIRSSSEAICETVGSIMGMHCGKNRFLKPENFSKEIVLRFNLGPMHLLDGLVGEVLALNTTKSYLREAVSIGRTVTKDLNKSASIGSFQERNEKKSRFPHSFWLSSSK